MTCFIIGKLLIVSGNVELNPELAQNHQSNVIAARVNAL